ncbi:MAG: hypothetical protein ACE5GM_09800 [bacterium]
MSLKERIGRVNPDMSFETTSRQRTEDDIRRERVVTIIVMVGIFLFILGAPFFVNMGKALFTIEPVIY